MTTKTAPNSKQVSHFERYREIGMAFSRHGLSHVIGRRFLGPAARARRLEAEPAVIREMFEDLGTTFVKLGQILSTRPDLISPAYQAEFAKLQDRALPVEVGTIRAIIEADLGKSIPELFRSFDDAPLASASIGQVHTATLHDGTEVAIKVRRPDVVEEVELDLEIMASLAKRAVKSWEWARRYDLPTLVQEFAETMRRELDYTIEARSAERCAAELVSEPKAHIPKIYREFSTGRILTMERMRGYKISDKEGMLRAGIDPAAAAETALDIFLKMVEAKVPDPTSWPTVHRLRDERSPGNRGR